MPKYEVIEQGFWGGVMYSPTGKRKVLHADKPLKPLPSWLKEVKPETAAEKKKRLAAEEVAKKADADKADQDRKDVDDMSFLGEGEAAATGAVETL
jgi:hypothetical protein